MARDTGIAATIFEGSPGDFIKSAPAGALRYDVYGAVPDSRVHYKCPCGCGSVGMVMVRPFPGLPFWSNVGTREKPTLQPSIGLNRGEQDEDIENDGYHWHGYLMDGVWHCVYAGRG